MISIMVGMGILALLPGTMAGKKVYGAKGESFEFNLEKQLQGPNLTSIIWKYNKDKAAEWFEGDQKPTYFGIFKSTATLDIKTGALTISNLQPSFSGEYSAQVNYKDSIQTLNLLVVDAVRVFGVKGQPITLQPEVPNIPVESAQWILNDNVIAHWDPDVSETSHQSLLLDKDTFYLTISFLQENYTGLYIFTIDDFETKVSYQLRLKVRLIIKKQCNSTTCNLKCTGADNETPLVTWTDNKGRKMSGPVWVVEKTEHLDVNYNCSSSSGSWETISERELFADYLVKDTTGDNLGIILGSVIGLMVLIVIITVVVYSTRNVKVIPSQMEMHKYLKRL